MNRGGQWQPLGATHWCIADAYIPGWSSGASPEMSGHEAICVLNTGDGAAQIELWVFFEDRDPVGPYHLTAGGRRTAHFRLNDLKDPEPLPRGRGMAWLLESDVPVIVQHTRLDSRQAENAVFSHMAMPF